MAAEVQRQRTSDLEQYSLNGADSEFLVRSKVRKGTCASNLSASEDPHAVRRKFFDKKFRSDTKTFAEKRRLSVLRPQLSEATVKRASSFSQMCQERLETRSFDLAMAAVIMLNVITIGVEQTLRLESIIEDISWSATLLESVFLTIYIGELLLRFSAYGKSMFKVSWVRFDTFLVIMAIVSDWLLPAFAVKSDEVAMVFRFARLSRLARALRLLVKFRELYMLVHCFTNSAKTVLYTALWGTVILYMFSSVAMEIITIKYANEEDMPEGVAEVVANYFPSLPMTMLTLVQFVCMDSIGDIYRPLIKHDWVLAVYFMAVILAVSVVLMNIVSAIMVSNAVTQSAEDREARKVSEEAHKAQLLKGMRDVLVEIDEDNSGTIDLDELRGALEQETSKLEEIQAHVDVEDIFLALDILDDGYLDIDEFCDALYQCAFAKLPIEMKRIDKQITTFLDLYMKDRKAARLDAVSNARALAKLQDDLDELRSTLPGDAPKCPGPTLKSGNDFMDASSKAVSTMDTKVCFLDEGRQGLAPDAQPVFCRPNTSFEELKLLASLPFTTIDVEDGSTKCSTNFSGDVAGCCPDGLPPMAGFSALPLWARVLERDLCTLRFKIRQLADAACSVRSPSSTGSIAEAPTSQAFLADCSVGLGGPGASRLRSSTWASAASDARLGSALCVSLAAKVVEDTLASTDMQDAVRRVRIQGAPKDMVRQRSCC